MHILVSQGTIIRNNTCNDVMHEVGILPLLHTKPQVVRCVDRAFRPQLVRAVQRALRTAGAASAVSSVSAAGLDPEERGGGAGGAGDGAAASKPAKDGEKARGQPLLAHCLWGAWAQYGAAQCGARRDGEGVVVSIMRRTNSLLHSRRREGG